MYKVRPKEPFGNILPLNIHLPIDPSWKCYFVKQNYIEPHQKKYKEQELQSIRELRHVNCKVV